MSMSESPTPGGKRSWTRRYPPLGIVAVALLLVLAVLPSALTLPQSNPSEVPEYAPVPPEDEAPPPATSNVSNLGLGSSSGVTTEVKPPKLPEPPSGVGGSPPSVYDCVSGKQTEDPLSPPCSPFYAGDNGGATYQGVTEDEIRVIFYMDGSIGTTGTASYDGGSEVAPLQKTYCDVNAKPNSDEKCLNESDEDHMYVRITRAFQRYMNARFQTYGRRFHFWVYYSGATDAGGRRADAADNFAKIKPFAVIDSAIFRGDTDAYIDAMARNGVLLFSSEQAQSRDFYDQYHPLVWSFFPDIEHQVDHYVEWICKKVAPYPVSHGGPGIENGQKRKYAFYHTTDRGRKDLLYLAQLAKPRLERECGIDAAMTATFPTAGYTINTAGDPAYARLNAARLKSAGVTTLLWLGGVDGKTEAAADEAKYYPEVFFAGDRYMEGTATGFYGNRNFHAQVAVMTYVLREKRLEDTPGYQAWRQAEPDRPHLPEGPWVNGVYRDFFMVASAVQVAGPRLHPTTVAEGFRAIDPVASTDPFTPACFFTQGHFCVQDAMEVWWDNTGTPPTATRGSSGCYRTVREGRRFVLGGWPKGDDVFKNRDDPCNNYNNGARLAIGTPGLEE